ncbi:MULTISPECIES: DoxX family protein [unclassified Rhizobium]|uniref:DoxX family protein n=1 Tax=unclassified Rhizobium TaxID=2613769 RepID=UPI0017854510|nr:MULTISPECIES: DoxX family protein [unclassified Rhizobium]MBD8686553.1 DoxX family protein [Rhizobium sp. CFBP 13644]MBD8691646.1 DoxX family protein [Rhizobium sp. CFBP 13717]
MPHNAPFSNARKTLLLPFLSGFYDKFAQPLAWTAMRVAIGGMLVIEGYPKILAPFAQVGFVENLGFYPGWLWSPTLAGLQFFGGMFIALGLLTRPVALANMVMLAITLWFHFANPYGHALLTEAGMEALKAADQTFFTPQGLRRLADGGTVFLEQVQTKAELASLFWTGGAALFAAFGGGYWSLDKLFRKQF